MRCTIAVLSIIAIALLLMPCVAYAFGEGMESYDCEELLGSETDEQQGLRYSLTAHIGEALKLSLSAKNVSEQAIELTPGREADVEFRILRSGELLWSEPIQLGWQERWNTSSIAPGSTLTCFTYCLVLRSGAEIADMRPETPLTFEVQHLLPAGSNRVSLELQPAQLAGKVPYARTALMHWMRYSSGEPGYDWPAGYWESQEVFAELLEELDWFPLYRLDDATRVLPGNWCYGALNALSGLGINTGVRSSYPELKDCLTVGEMREVVDRYSAHEASLLGSFGPALALDLQWELGTGVGAGRAEDAEARSGVEVPLDHRAYPLLNYLCTVAILEGYPEGFFTRERLLTRYELAQATARALDSLGQEAIDSRKPHIYSMVRDLEAEFLPELSAMHVASIWFSERWW